MKSLRPHVRRIAAFFLIQLIGSVVYPTVSWALTAGPTAPEYTSFEPVDTTDMVNLATGDFVYNIPLLEVPGPAGGYPVSLSYHAGIMPNEEASWVGLGWTLNPGAITRSVNGYPDDQNGSERVRNDYVHGGERNTFSVGLGVPGVSFGISVSNDTYQGFGVGQNIGIGIPLGNSQSTKAIGLNVGFDVGHDGYGNIFSGLNAGMTYGKGGRANAEGAKYSLGISSNFNSVSFSGGISQGGNSIIGGSIDSKGLQPSMSVGGVSVYQHNSRANKWTVNSSGISVPVPLGGGFWLTLGYRYMRYYIDETETVNVIGALHSDKANAISQTNYDDWSFDSYSLIEIERDFVEQDPDKSRGGSFPSFDSYTVSAQGLSGSMRPYTFGVGNLFRQNVKKGNDNSKYEVQFFNQGANLPKSYFRFVNDFSNSLVFDSTAVLNATTMYTEKGLPTSPSEGFKSSKLAGSKNIEHFTNAELKSGTGKTKDFIDFQMHNLRVLNKHNTDLSDQIGGYKITNESGVTYHYAIPVYAYGEYSRNQKKSEPNKVFTEYNHDEAYAYTWLLTAITGPDFVDRGGANNESNGILDDADWGYWVKFDYGLWTNNYEWRNPFEGAHSDIDSEFETYSSGFKELYYLNTIETKSHVAIFEKEIRADGKGVIDKNGNFGHANTSQSWSYESSEIDENKYNDCMNECNATCNSYNSCGSCSANCAADSKKVKTISVPFKNYSKSTLRLNNIYLVNKEDFKYSLKNYSTNYNHLFTYSQTNEDLTKTVDVEVHKGFNIIDKFDLDRIQSEELSYRDILLSKSIRVIAMSHSYRLQGNLPNSFDLDGSMYTQWPGVDETNTKYGKLTLDAIRFLGKEGLPITPPMKFTYDLNEEFQMGMITGNSWVPSLNGSNLELKPGDIIKSNSTFYLCTKELIVGESYKLKKIAGPIIIAGGGSGQGTSIDFTRTKNPPYNKDAYDIWGFYKSDFSQSLYNENENVARMVSDISSKSTDVWSLRSIASSLGSTISIEYESDDYKIPELYQHYLVPVNGYDKIQNRINVPISLPELNSIFNVGDEIQFLYQWEYTFKDSHNIKYRLYENARQKTKINSIVDDGTSKYLEIDEIHNTPGMKTYSQNGLVTGCPYRRDFILNGNTILSNLVLDDCEECVYWCKYSGGPKHDETFYMSFPHDYDFSSNAVVWWHDNSPFGSLFSEKLVSGVISISGSEYPTKGGGIRVKNIKNRLGSNHLKTDYSYSNFDANITTGTTSFEPFGADLTHNLIPFDPNPSFNHELNSQKELDKYLNEWLSNLLLVSREVPAPGVIYEYVTVNEEVNGLRAPGKQVYHFQTFEENFIERVSIKDTNVTTSTSTFCNCSDIVAYCEGLYKDPPEELIDPGCMESYNCSYLLAECENNSVNGQIEIESSNTATLISPLTIRDYSMRVGNLKSVKTYGENDVLLSETKTTYQYELGKVLNEDSSIDWDKTNKNYRKAVGAKFANQGVVQQMFTESRKGRKEDNTYEYFRVLSKKEEYPAIVVAKETTNHRTGLTTTSRNLAFDFYSGEVTATYTEDGYGNKYVTKSVPAYRLEKATGVRAYPGMGLAMNGGANMLTQEGATYTYMVDDTYDPVPNNDVNYTPHITAVVSAGLQTWSNANDVRDGETMAYTVANPDGIYRKKATYSFIGDNTAMVHGGLFNPASFSEATLEADNTFSSTKWQKNAEITLYDVNSHALEAMDINDNYAATRMDAQNTRVIGTVANARYGEFTASGFETANEGEVAIQGTWAYGSPNSNEFGHSGNRTVKTTTASNAFSFQGTADEARKYKISYWSSSPASQVTVAGQTLSPKIVGTYGNWYLLEALTDVPIGTFTVQVKSTASGDIFYDDFRVHPIDATMTSYVYNQWGELSDILDANNLFTHYEYDGMGRLKSVTRETLKHGPVKTSEVQIVYARGGE